MSSIFYSAAPYHILSYGTLLGTEVFNSFVAGITSYRALPRPQFATLQTALMPVYFTMQTALPVVIALTFPAERTGIGMTPSSIAGVLAPEHRWSVLAPLSIVFVTSAMNLFYIGPETTRCMKRRKHQETRDGKKSYDPAPHSEAMQKLNTEFTYLHSASSLVNVFGCLATVWYGFYLGERIL